MKTFRAQSDLMAVDTLYREHLPAILRYLARRLGENVADEAAADVFVRAVRAHGAGQPLTLPWLYGVAANVISERRRAERRRLRAMERLASQAPRGTVEAPEDLDPRLIAGLRQLEAADREALLLVAWGELSYQEAAEALQIPVGTVRSRIARARGQLQSVTPRRASTLPCRAETRGFNV